MGKHFVLSRTDSIGDVVLTLPLAGILKQHFPDCHITFLGMQYTKAIVSCSQYIDDFVDWHELSKLSENEQIDRLRKLRIDVFIHVFPKKEIARLAKKAGIPQRIGTTNRLYHWFTCNKLVRFSRKKSDLHEAQLNIKLLKPLGIQTHYSLDELAGFYGLSPQGKLPHEIQQLIDSEKINVVLHPKSKGSAREWGLDNFEQLITLLPQDKFNVFVSGTEAEGVLFRDQLIRHNPFVHDISGKLSLDELIVFISKIDALIACSTGPLHIAAALGKTAVGIYPVQRPMHPGRWAPVGKNVYVFETEEVNHLLPVSPQAVMNILVKI